MQLPPPCGIFSVGLVCLLIFLSGNAEAQPVQFVRGDSNADGRVDISDAVATLGCLFLGDVCSVCADAADTNDDGSIDISDGIATLGFLFVGDLPPPAPFPFPGYDLTTSDANPCGDEPEEIDTSLVCGIPADGSILNLAPGSSVRFTGSVGDGSGVNEVRVNGAAVTVDETGVFSTMMTTKFGVNFVDIVVVDGIGREATRTCAFLVADSWTPDSSTLVGSASFRLAQSAIDDGSRTGSLRSLGDMLHAVLNGQDLPDALHSALLAANPLKRDSCDQSILGICVLSSEITYISSSLPGPNTVSLTLVNGGLAARVRFENPVVRLRVEGRASGIPYDTTGNVNFDFVEVDAVFDITIAGGRPRVTVRAGSVATRVGSISTNFRGLDGALVNLIVSVANGIVRNEVANTLRSWVVNTFDSALDMILGELDINTLSASFDVPRLDGTGSIPMSFARSCDSVSTTTTRMLFGLGTRFSAPPAHARSTLGAPAPGGTVLLDPATFLPVAVSIHIGSLGQAIHALWRGGFFDATLDSSQVSGLPPGVIVTLTTLLPPAVELVAADRVELSIGAVQSRLTHPSLATEPLDAVIGARASMSVRLVGEELVFEDFQIGELHLSTADVSVDAATRATIEEIFSRLLERIIGQALADALPALPIPAFYLPESLDMLGLPGGQSLGLTTPMLGRSGNHLLLTGGFGVQ